MALLLAKVREGAAGGVGDASDVGEGEGGEFGGGGPSGEGDSSDVGECEGGGVHQERVMALLLAKAREGGGLRRGWWPKQIEDTECWSGCHQSPQHAVDIALTLICCVCLFCCCKTTCTRTVGPMTETASRQRWARRLARQLLENTSTSP